MRQITTAPELSERDLESVQAGKELGGSANGGATTFLGRMGTRFLDNISIHLVPA